MAEIAAARRKPTAIAIARSVFISAPHTRERRSLGGSYTMMRKSLSRRGFRISNSNAFKSTTRRARCSRVAGAAPSGAQGVVQFSNQTFRPRNRVGRIVPSLSLLLVKIVRYVQRRENGNFCRVNRRRSLGYFFHP